MSNNNQCSFKNQEVVFRKLENDVDKKKKDLSKLSGMNKEVNKMISNMRKEKMIYIEIIEKMEKEIQSNQKYIKSLKKKELHLQKKKSSLQKKFKENKNEYVLEADNCFK